MMFSVFTVGTPDYTVEETVKKLKEFGYDGIEWRVGTALKEESETIPSVEQWYWAYNKSTVDEDSILDNAEYIKRLCEENEIEISALATYIPCSEYARV